MPKLYIPQVGDTLKLTANWECKVFNEYRNRKLLEELGLDSSDSKDTNVDITLPKETILKVSRLYVRAPASSFDSITFVIDSSPIKALVKKRFWVKLMDANNIEYEEVKQSIESYKKLVDAYRFVALKNGYQNSLHLTSSEENMVSKEIFDYFKQKKDNEITIKFEIEPEDMFKYGMETNHSRHLRVEDILEYKKQKVEMMKKVFNQTDITLHLLPVLGGFVYYYDKNEDAIKCEEALQINVNEVTSHYGWGREKQCGSFLNKINYKTRTEKSLSPSFVFGRTKELPNMIVKFKGDILKMNDFKDLEKLVKKAIKK